MGSVGSLPLNQMVFVCAAHLRAFDHDGFLCLQIYGDQQFFLCNLLIAFHYRTQHLRQWRVSTQVLRSSGLSAQQLSPTPRGRTSPTDVRYLNTITQGLS